MFVPALQVQGHLRHSHRGCVLLQALDDGYCSGVVLVIDGVKNGTEEEGGGVSLLSRVPATEIYRGHTHQRERGITHDNI